MFDISTKSFLNKDSPKNPGNSEPTVFIKFQAGNLDQPKLRGLFCHWGAEMLACWIPPVFTCVWKSV